MVGSYHPFLILNGGRTGFIIRLMSFPPILNAISKDEDSRKVSEITLWRKKFPYNILMYHSLAGGQSVDATLDDMNIDGDAVKRIIQYTKGLDLPRDLSMVPGGIIDILTEYFDILRLLTVETQCDRIVTQSLSDLPAAKIAVAGLRCDQSLVRLPLVSVAVNNDNFPLIRMMAAKSELFETVINCSVNRCGDLSINKDAEKYWKLVSGQYFELFKEWSSYPSAKFFLMKIGTLFPQLNSTSPFVKLPIRIKRYLLGSSPDSEHMDTHTRILEGHLCSQGPNNYIEKYVKPMVETKLKLFKAFHHLPADMSVHNDCDIMYERYTDYAPFDIIFYLEGGSRLFFFSRPEFPILLEKKVNHWTTESLSPDFLKVIAGLVDKARKYNLPESGNLELKLKTYLYN